MADKNTNPEAEEHAQKKRDITRRSFRVPVDDSYILRVRIGGEDFGAFDIVEGGMGVFQSMHNLFSIGEILEDITLMFKGEPLQLQGKVLHISRDDNNFFRYGVQFTKLDPKTEDKLVEFVSSTRKDYFQDNE